MKNSINKKLILLIVLLASMSQAIYTNATINAYIQFENCEISNNNVDIAPLPIVNISSDSAGIHATGHEISLIHCTIAGNYREVDTNSTLENATIGVVSDRPLHVINSIISNNFYIRDSIPVTGKNITVPAGTSVFEYSNIAGLTTIDLDKGLSKNNIDVDPKFTLFTTVNPSENNYRLSTGSPCIGRANPLFISPVLNQDIADLNFDGLVNELDLDIVIANFGNGTGLKDLFNVRNSFIQSQDIQWVDRLDRFDIGAHKYDNLGTNIIENDNLVLWLKANKSDLGNVDDGTAVAEWTDNSGKLNNFTPDVTSNNITFTEQSDYYQPTVKFTGINNHLKSANDVVVKSVIMVFASDAETIYNQAGDTIVTSAATGQTLLGDTTSTAHPFTGYNNSANVIGRDKQLFVDDLTPEALYYLNGKTTDHATIEHKKYYQTLSVDLNNTFTLKDIGAESGLVNTHWNGKISEILAFTEHPTATQRRNIEAYLNTKYHTNGSQKPEIAIQYYGVNAAATNSIADGTIDNLVSTSGGTYVIDTLNLKAVVADDGITNTDETLTHQWIQISGPSLATINITDSMKPEEAEIKFEQKTSSFGVYVFQYKASNNDANASATVSVVVQHNSSITVNSITDGKQIQSNAGSVNLATSITSTYALANLKYQIYQGDVLIKEFDNINMSQSGNTYSSTVVWDNSIPAEMPIVDESYRLMVTATDAIGQIEIYNALLKIEFDPSNIPNMILWLDANKDVTVIGGEVTKWDDQSGKEYDVSKAIVNVNANATYPGPTLVTAIGNNLSGKKYLQFQGAANAITNTVLAFDNGNVKRPIHIKTVFMVIKNDYSTTHNKTRQFTILGGKVNNANQNDFWNGREQGTPANSPNEKFDMWNAQSHKQVRGGKHFVNGQYIPNRSTYESNVLLPDEFQIIAVKVDIGTTNNDPNGLDVELIGGTNNTESLYRTWNGGIAEILLFGGNANDGHLSDENIHKVGKYLARKYDIPYEGLTTGNPNSIAIVSPKNNTGTYDLDQNLDIKVSTNITPKSGTNVKIFRVYGNDTTDELGNAPFAPSQGDYVYKWVDLPIGRHTIEARVEDKDGIIHKSTQKIITVFGKSILTDSAPVDSDGDLIDDWIEYARYGNLGKGSNDFNSTGLLRLAASDLHRYLGRTLTLRDSSEITLQFENYDPVHDSFTLTDQFGNVININLNLGALSFSPTVWSENAPVLASSLLQNYTLTMTDGSESGKKTIYNIFFKIDATPPTVKVDIKGKRLFEDTQVGLIASETGSIIYYTTDGSIADTTSITQLTTSGSINLTKDLASNNGNTIVLRYIAKDLAGNVGPEQIQVYTFGTLPPSPINLSITISRTANVIDKVEALWDQVNANPGSPQNAGYNLYKAENVFDIKLLNDAIIGGFSPPKTLKINAKLLSTIKYTDSNIIPGGTVYYCVTSFDQDGNESPPSKLIAANLLTTVDPSNEAQGIKRAVSWISQNQNQNGAWGTDDVPSILATSQVLNALQNYTITLETTSETQWSEIYKHSALRGLFYMYSRVTESNDELSRIITTLQKYNMKPSGAFNFDTRGMHASLGMRHKMKDYGTTATPNNRYAGWGTSRRYMPDALNTALAMYARLQPRPSNWTSIPFEKLVTQNPDVYEDKLVTHPLAEFANASGDHRFEAYDTNTTNTNAFTYSWVPKTKRDIYVTAYVRHVLNTANANGITGKDKDDVSVPWAPIVWTDSKNNWIRTEFILAADGSYGKSVINTAAVLLWLNPVDVVNGSQYKSAARQYLLDTQKPNGSWNNDPFLTGLCLEALLSSAP